MSPGLNHLNWLLLRHSSLCADSSSQKYILGYFVGSGWDRLSDADVLSALPGNFFPYCRCKGAFPNEMASKVIHVTACMVWCSGCDMATNDEMGSDE